MRSQMSEWATRFFDPVAIAWAFISAIAIELAKRLKRPLVSGIMIFADDVRTAILYLTYYPIDFAHQFLANHDRIFYRRVGLELEMNLVGTVISWLFDFLLAPSCIFFREYTLRRRADKIRRIDLRRAIPWLILDFCRALRVKSRLRSLAPVDPDDDEDLATAIANYEHEKELAAYKPDGSTVAAMVRLHVIRIAWLKRC